MIGNLLHLVRHHINDDVLTVCPMGIVLQNLGGNVNVLLGQVPGQINQVEGVGGPILNVRMSYSATSLINTLVGLFVLVCLMATVNPSHQTWHLMFEKVSFKRAYLFKSTCLNGQCITVEERVSAQFLQNIIRNH